MKVIKKWIVNKDTSEVVFFNPKFFCNISVRYLKILRYQEKNVIIWGIDLAILTVY